MKSELNQVQNPRRIYLFWISLYVVTITLVCLVLYFFATKIQTHSIPEGSIKLSVPYSKYIVGEPITFSLKNNYNSSIYVLNNCPSEPLEVYKNDGNKWVKQHLSIDAKDCEDDERVINVPANGVVNGSYEKWSKLFNEPGKYRIVAFVEYYNEVLYQDIEIIKKLETKQSTGTSPNTTKPQTQTENEPEQSETTQDSTPEVNSFTNKQSKTVTVAGNTIKVQYDSVNVYVISIAPANGCRYEGGRSGREVEVTFKCSSGETQVQLWVSNGQLMTKVENED